MAIDAKQLLKFAETLAKDDKEVSCRSAVSRAYYAAYHYISDTLSLARPEKTTGGVHSRLISMLSESKETKFRQIGIMLGQAHSLRITADYHLDREINKQDAEMQIESIKRLISLVDQLVASDSANSAN